MNIDLGKASRDYYYQLEKEIEKYFREGKTGKELIKYIAKYGKDMVAELKEEVWKSLRSMTELEIKELNTIAEPILKGFSRMKSGLEKDLIFELHVDDTRQKKEARIKHRLGIKQHTARTLIKTGSDAITQAKRVNDSLEAGMEYFKYIGPAPEREFCIEHYNKTYSKAEIEKMDNGQRLPVLYYGGGYNCHHQWVGVISIDEKGQVTSEVTKADQIKNLDVSEIFENNFYRPEKVIYHKDLTKDQIEERTKCLASLFKEYKFDEFYKKTKFVVKFESGRSYYGKKVTMNDGTMLVEVNFGHEVDRRRTDEGSPFLQKSRVDKENLQVSTLVHEFGHLITTKEQALRYNKIAEFWDGIQSVYKKHNKEYKKELDKADIESNFWTNDYIGSYGMKGSSKKNQLSEFMAEAFTNYRLSSSPSKYSVEVGQLINKYFGREK